MDDDEEDSSSPHLVAQQGIGSVEFGWQWHAFAIGLSAVGAASDTH